MTDADADPVWLIYSILDAVWYGGCPILNLRAGPRGKVPVVCLRRAESAAVQARPAVAADY